MHICVSGKDLRFRPFGPGKALPQSPNPASTQNLLSSSRNTLPLKLPGSAPRLYKTAPQISVYKISKRLPSTNGMTFPSSRTPALCPSQRCLLLKALPKALQTLQHPRITCSPFECCHLILVLEGFPRISPYPLTGLFKLEASAAKGTKFSQGCRPFPLLKTGLCDWKLLGVAAQ